MLRNGVFDNTKFLMISLVVFGHLIEPFINKNDLVKTIYLSIYSFHMPVFIILSGMLTTIDTSENRINKNIISLLIPLIAFTVLYEIFNFVVKNQISRYTLNLQPYWILWFLLSLFIWKSTLPVIMQFRYPLTLSLIISLGAGLFNNVGYFLGLSRTLYFFPFFILGHQLGAQGLKNVSLKKIPKSVYILLLILNIIFFWSVNDYSHKWLYGSFSYQKLGFEQVYGTMVRATLYFVSFASAIAVLMVIPSRQSLLSKSGEHSLMVYLWHGFVVKLALSQGLLGALFRVSTPFALICLLIISALLSLLLSRPSVSELTQRAIMRPIQRLFLRTKPK